MSVAILNDDAALYNKAVSLFQATVKHYIRWGFDPATSATRIIGECTETLRDVSGGLKAGWLLLSLSLCGTLE
jgi:hypothetical protein